MAPEGEAPHLIGAAPAPSRHSQPAEVPEPGRRSAEKVCVEPSNAMGEEEEEEARHLLQQKPDPVYPVPNSDYLAALSAASMRAMVPRPWPSVPPSSLFSSLFSRLVPPRIVIPSLLDDEEFERFLQDLERSKMPSASELAAQDRQIVMECLRHYNSNHPGNEYVPAPGKVTCYRSPHNGSCWAHGNFVASPKRPGCFSFLPARRTLFFYELVSKDGFNEAVVSCTPLDEPVTEAYSFLGLHLGWGTRHDGSMDCRCKTCNQLVYSRNPFVGKAFPCGHYKAECVCEMCYTYSGVLHPLPEKFSLGNAD